MEHEVDDQWDGDLDNEMSPYIPISANFVDNI